MIANICGQNCTLLSGLVREGCSSAMWGTFEHQYSAYDFSSTICEPR